LAGARVGGARVGEGTGWRGHGLARARVGEGTGWRGHGLARARGKALDDLVARQRSGFVIFW
jgi:hypothetical protein